MLKSGAPQFDRKNPVFQRQQIIKGDVLSVWVSSNQKSLKSYEDNSLFTLLCDSELDVSVSVPGVVLAWGGEGSILTM